MKKYLGLLVALLLCAVLLSGCSDGATKGEYFTYIVETDGTATITGYIGNERAVVIPKKIDGHKICEIGAGAFDENTIVETITLQDGIQKIGPRAFASCSNLTEIIISDTVSYIGEYAFQETSLESISIPEGITCIEKETFYKCEELNEVKLPESMEYIAESAFCNCKRLYYIHLPDNVYYIGESAFLHSGLRRIEMPTQIKEENWKYAEIGRYAFADSDIRTITIPEGIHSIGFRAFNDCYFLSEIVIPATVTSIGDDIFLGVNVEKIIVEKDSYAAHFFYNHKGRVIVE